MGEDGEPLDMSRARDAKDHQDRADDILDELASDYEDAFEGLFDADVNAEVTVDEEHEVAHVEVSVPEARPDELGGDLFVSQTSPLIFRVGKADMGPVETQRDRLRGMKELVGDLQEQFDDGAPIDLALDLAERNGIPRTDANEEIEKLKQQGELYQPNEGHLRTL